MNIEEIRNYCLSLLGVTEDIKWEDHLCFNIGSKMFLVTNPNKFPVSASFKTTDKLFNELTMKDGVIPAPYMARHKWVYVDNIDRLVKSEWKEFIKIAYELVLTKLPVKIKMQIVRQKNVSKPPYRCKR